MDMIFYFYLIISLVILLWGMTLRKNRDLYLTSSWIWWLSLLMLLIGETIHLMILKEKQIIVFGRTLLSQEYVSQASLIRLLAFIFLILYGYLFAKIITVRKNNNLTE